MTAETTRTDAGGRFRWLRRFVVGLVPLGCIYAVSAVLYRQSNEAAWMWVNLGVFALMVVYLLVVMFRRPTQDAPRKVTTPAWAQALFRFVDDDDWFAIIILGLSVILMVLGFFSNWLDWGGAVLWTLTAILAAVYLVYMLMLAFAGGYRALLTLMNARELELLQAKRENEMLKRENILASRTHDTVSSALSSIALFAEQERDCAERESESSKWATVNETALKALDNLHQVIDMLGTSDTAPSQDISSVNAEPIASLGSPLKHMAEQEDHRLHVLGFPGSTEITGDYAGNGGEAGEEVVGLLTELYANVGDHAASECRYHITIALEETHVVVEQTNSVANHDHKPPSGRGLKLHRATIQQLGGDLSYNSDDGQFRLIARIPLPAVESSR